MPLKHTCELGVRKFVGRFNRARLNDRRFKRYYRSLVESRGRFPMGLFQFPNDFVREFFRGRFEIRFGRDSKVEKRIPGGRDSKRHCR